MPLHVGSLRRAAHRDGGAGSRWPCSQAQAGGQASRPHAAARGPRRPESRATPAHRLRNWLSWLPRIASTGYRARCQHRRDVSHFGRCRPARQVPFGDQKLRPPGGGLVYGRTQRSNRVGLGGRPSPPEPPGSSSASWIRPSTPKFFSPMCTVAHRGELAQQRSRRRCAGSARAATKRRYAGGARDHVVRGSRGQAVDYHRTGPAGQPRSSGRRPAQYRWAPPLASLPRGAAALALAPLASSTSSMVGDGSGQADNATDVYLQALGRGCSPRQLGGAVVYRENRDGPGRTPQGRHRWRQGAPGDGAASTAASWPATSALNARLTLSRSRAWTTLRSPVPRG